MTPQLKRELGLLGAVLMGLGAIVGTGVFVSIGTSAEMAGAGVILAIILAGGVAMCNGFNSAQLAASHPVSGGTYEYGYKYLNSWWGFTAGWLFLLAKSASAATAALGFAGYLAAMTGIDPFWCVPIAVGVVLLFTILASLGITRSNWANTAIVLVTMGTLLFFVVGGTPLLMEGRLFNASWGSIGQVLQAVALMFVAYTGYGRIATMGEEVADPHRNIPRAMTITLFVSMAIYVLVGVVGVAGGIKGESAPLVGVGQQYALPFSGEILTIGASTAMLGVLLNLILGLSRVLLAMARRGDMPTMLAQITKWGSPVPAVATVGLVIGLLALWENVKTTWSFSAFTVLMYYGITNLCALRLPAQDRLYPSWLAWVGLCACGFLAFWVDWQVWLGGLGMIALGLVWHLTAKHIMNSVG
ncbi:MAG: APC family permease [Pseudanabaenaceae cyanobacterium]